MLFLWPKINKILISKNTSDKKYLHLPAGLFLMGSNRLILTDNLL